MPAQLLKSSKKPFVICRGFSHKLKQTIYMAVWLVWYNTYSSSTLQLIKESEWSPRLHGLVEINSILNGKWCASHKHFLLKHVVLVIVRDETLSRWNDLVWDFLLLYTDIGSVHWYKSGLTPLELQRCKTSARRIKPIINYIDAYRVAQIGTEDCQI